MRIIKKIISDALQNIVSVIPFLFILVMLMLHLVLPDKTFSKDEMRYLAQWPAFHVERVIDGSYMTKVESYFSDQFPFRDFWVHIQKLGKNGRCI
ncbi:MAG: DHHW family protein [Anaerocolumna sp.]